MLFTLVLSEKSMTITPNSHLPFWKLNISSDNNVNIIVVVQLFYSFEFGFDDTVKSFV